MGWTAINFPFLLIICAYVHGKINNRFIFCGWDHATKWSPTGYSAVNLTRSERSLRSNFRILAEWAQCFLWTAIWKFRHSHQATKSWETLPTTLCFKPSIYLSRRSGILANVKVFRQCDGRETIFRFWSAVIHSSTSQELNLSCDTVQNIIAENLARRKECANKK